MGEVALIVHILRFDAGIAAERLVQRQGRETVFCALCIDERSDLLLIAGYGCTAGRLRGLFRFRRLLRLGGLLRLRRSAGRLIAAADAEAVTEELFPAVGRPRPDRAAVTRRACGERC